jgi:hypothetical protein
MRTTESVEGDPTRFNVRDNSSGATSLSIELVQVLVDAALKLPNVRAFRKDRGIGFEPNFVWVEYLPTTRLGSIMLSFYGGPDRHRNPLLRAGRTESYSRASIHTADELKKVLPCVEKAYRLKLG